MGGEGGRGGECIKQGAADRIERASASPPLMGSDVKRRNTAKNVILLHRKCIYSTRKIYFFNTDYSWYVQQLNWMSA